jgi:hypothetical protein
VAEREHSPIGASGMYRWGVCPGSVRLSKDQPDVHRRYTAEGTLAHALAFDTLLGQHKGWPQAELNREHMVDKHLFVVDQDMIDGVQLYVDTVKSTYKPKEDDQLFVEHHFDLSNIHPQLGGTADAVTWKPKSQVLIVDDFKYGAGLLVMPAKNEQQMYYGLGALVTLKFPAREVWLRIIQPRIDHPEGPVRTWKMPAVDLLDFWAHLKERALATEDPNAPLVAGDHCQFCRAIRICPELERHTQAVAKMEFGPALQYDPKKLAEGLHMADALEYRIKAMREFAYQEAMQGRSPPGWKIVAKRAHRKWKNEAVAVETLSALLENIYEPVTLKSPAQIEKLLPKNDKKTLADLVEKKSSGFVLVKDSDPRLPAPLDAKSEFAALPDLVNEP